MPQEEAAAQEKAAPAPQEETAAQEEAGTAPQEEYAAQGAEEALLPPRPPSPPPPVCPLPNPRDGVKRRDGVDSVLRGVAVYSSFGRGVPFLCIAGGRCVRGCRCARPLVIRPLLLQLQLLLRLLIGLLLWLLLLLLWKIQQQ